jgi:hypothetical protein
MHDLPCPVYPLEYLWLICHPFLFSLYLGSLAGMYPSVNLKGYIGVIPRFHVWVLARGLGY